MGGTRRGPVDPTRQNGVSDRLWKEIAHGTPVAQARTQIRRRNVETGDLDEAQPRVGLPMPARTAVQRELDVAADGRWQPVREAAGAQGGPHHHRVVGEREQRGRLPPRAHLRERIGSDQEHRLLVAARQPFSQRAERLDEVGGAPAVDLDRLGGEARVVGDRAPHPVESQRGRRDRVARVVGLVRRHRARHEQHARQTERLRHLLGRTQVPDVDRVERAAVDADEAQRQSGRSWPSPNSTNFCAVSPSSPIGPYAWSFDVEIPISAPRPRR